MISVDSLFAGFIQIFGNQKQAKPHQTKQTTDSKKSKRIWPILNPSDPFLIFAKPMTKAMHFSSLSISLPRRNSVRPFLSLPLEVVVNPLRSVCLSLLLLLTDMRISLSLRRRLIIWVRSSNLFWRDWTRWSTIRTLTTTSSNQPRTTWRKPSSE